jgi:hypothetical protein
MSAEPAAWRRLAKLGSEGGRTVRPPRLFEEQLSPNDRYGWERRSERDEWRIG